MKRFSKSSYTLNLWVFCTDNSSVKEKKGIHDITISFGVHFIQTVIYA